MDYFFRQITDKSLFSFWTKNCNFFSLSLPVRFTVLQLFSPSPSPLQLACILVEAKAKTSTTADISQCWAEQTRLLHACWLHSYLCTPGHCTAPWTSMIHFFKHHNTADLGSTTFWSSTRRRSLLEGLPPIWLLPFWTGPADTPASVCDFSFASLAL